VNAGPGSRPAFRKNQSQQRLSIARSTVGPAFARIHEWSRVLIRTSRGRTSIAVAIAAVLAGGLSACSSGASGETQGVAAPAVPKGDALNLTNVCPSNIVIQSGWFPTADVGVAFELFGGDYRIDAKRFRVSGSLVVNGKDTGVDLEYRSGGPAVGFQNGPAVAYTDPAITFVITNIDEMIATSSKAPMQAVIAPVNGDPQSVIYDPKTYPQFNTLGDIGQTNTTIYYSQNANAAFGYLAGAGILRPGQLNASYDGSPSQFVAAKGKAAVQGYATNEVYVYENLPQWHRPVAYKLIQDSGYPDYAGVLAIRPRDKAKLTPCLRRLVPIFQQATVDQWKNPTQAAARIVRSVAGFETFFQYGAGNAQFGYCQLDREGLTSNPRNGPVGTMAPNKVQRVLDILRPIFLGQKSSVGTLRRVNVPSDLTAQKLATNEFLDPSLRLPSGEPSFYSSCEPQGNS
jgi:hypothetical protein